MTWDHANGVIEVMSYLYCAVGTPSSPRPDQAICQSIIYALLEQANLTFFVKCHGNTTGRDSC